MVDKSDLGVAGSSEPSSFPDQSQSDGVYEVAQATTTAASSGESQQTLEWGIKGTQTTVEGGDTSYVLSFSGGAPVGDQKISISLELRLDNGDDINPAELEDLSGNLANALKANAPAGFKVIGDGMGPVTIEVDGSASVNNISFTLPTVDDSEVEPLEDFSIILSDPGSNTGSLVTKLSSDLKEVRTRLSDNDQKDQDNTVKTEEESPGGQPALTAERVSSVDETAIRARLEIGADNTVKIPGDVRIDAILVSGNDIIIRGADGSLYVIVDGFKQVPTIQLNGFDIPSAALTASLNAANILPAAGPESADQPASTSSGGNFATDPGGVGDPFDITDLLPPTAFSRAFDNAEEFQPFIERSVSAPDTPLEILSVIPTTPVVSDPALPDGTDPDPSGVEEADSDVTIQAGSTPVVSLEFDGSLLSGIQVTDSNGLPILDENLTPVVFVWTLVGNDIIIGSVGGVDVIQIVIDLPSPIPAGTTGDGNINTLLLDDFPHQYGANGVDDATISGVPILATDSGGNTDTATIDIIVLDDVPTARADFDTVIEGGNTDGNVITGVDANDADGSPDATEADTLGADGATVTSVTATTAGGNATAIGTNTVVTGQYGTLTISDDGSYSYVSDPNVVSPAGVTDVFSYTLTDGDGDVSTVDLTINIDDSGLVTPDYDVTVNEAALDTNALPDGDDLVVGTVTGSLPGSTAETNGGTAVATGGTPTYSYALQTGGNAVTAGAYGSIQLDSDGSYTYTLDDNYINATADDGAQTIDSLVTGESFTYVATDSFGNTTTGTISIDIVDDVPTAAISVGGGALVVDESVRDLGGDTNFDDEDGETDPFGYGTLIGYAVALSAAIISNTSIAGADGFASNLVTLTNSSGGTINGENSGLTHTETGNSIFLFTDGSGNIVGREGTSALDAATGDVVFAIGFDGNELVVAQYEAVFHGDDTNPDDVVSLSDTVYATVTVTDGDGDVSTATSTSGLNLAFEDDGPSIGTIEDSLANNNPLSAVTTGSLNFTPGVDGDGGVDNITLDTTGLTSSGFQLVTAVTGSVLTAYADVDGSGTVNAGDTSVFTLTVDTTGGPSNGTYTFDLISPLDGTVVNTSIGGSTAYGAGPSGAQVLDDGSGSNLALISGWNITGSFNQAAWFGGANPDPVNDLTLHDVNGSTGGWGVDNNNFTAGEFMRFDFGSVDDFDGIAGPYAPPVVSLATVAFATFDLIGYSGSDTIDFVIHHTDGSTSPFTATSADFGSPYTINADVGKFIDWIDVLSVNATGGAKISLTDVGVQQSTTDTDIGFSISLADGDGDSVTGSFVINVADGNTPSTATPVILDLDGDGIETISLNSNTAVAFDYDGDGTASTTAWVGADDGLLAVDLNNDGIINDGSEIVFSQYAEDAETDLEGLAAAFDTNQDGKLTSADELFEQFGVWQDADSDGITDKGEFYTLTELGIVEIGLTSDGIQSSSEDGSVTLYGTSSYTNADGSTGAVGDVGFAYSSNSAEIVPDGEDVFVLDASALTDADIIEDYILSEDTVDLTAIVDVASGDANGDVNSYVRLDNGELQVDVDGTAGTETWETVATFDTTVVEVNILYDDADAGSDQSGNIT